MIDLSAPLEGMMRAESKVMKVAARIAQTPEQGDAVDLSAEMVALLQARNDYSANVNVARTLDELSRKILDVVA